MDGFMDCRLPYIKCFSHLPSWLALALSQIYLILINPNQGRERTIVELIQLQDFSSSDSLPCLSCRGHFFLDEASPCIQTGFFLIAATKSWSFICCAQITSLTCKWLQFKITSLTCKWITMSDKFKGVFAEKKTSFWIRDLNPRLSDPVDLLCCCFIISAWLPSGAHGWALSSCQYPEWPRSGCQQAASIVSQAFPGSVSQERVGFTCNPAPLGPPSYPVVYGRL